MKNRTPRFVLALLKIAFYSCLLFSTIAIFKVFYFNGLTEAPAQARNSAIMLSATESLALLLVAFLIGIGIFNRGGWTPKPEKQYRLQI